MERRDGETYLLPAVLTCSRCSSTARATACFTSVGVIVQCQPQGAISPVSCAASTAPSGGAVFLMTEAFQQVGQRDSAVVHWRAVEKAWRRADPEFRERYERARLEAGT